jgi:hypothetical protein
LVARLAPASGGTPTSGRCAARMVAGLFGSYRHRHRVRPESAVGIPRHQQTSPA